MENRSLPKLVLNWVSEERKVPWVGTTIGVQDNDVLEPLESIFGLVDEYDVWETKDNVINKWIVFLYE